MKTLIKSEEAQAGVGTLIIFIAMVLVAAVAAAVLIQTQGAMNAKSAATSSQSAQAISENLYVETIDGVVGSTYLNQFNITIRVAAGGSQVDLSKVLLKINGIPYNFSYSTNINTCTPQSSGNTFCVFALRAATSTDTGLGIINQYYNSTSSPAVPILNSGALARVDVNVSSQSLGSKAYVPIGLTPSMGSTVNNPVTLPGLSANSVVAIYP